MVSRVHGATDAKQAAERYFESRDRDSAGGALLRGTFVNLEAEPDVCLALTREVRKRSPLFCAPFLLIDLCDAEDLCIDFTETETEATENAKSISGGNIRELEVQTTAKGEDENLTSEERPPPAKLPPGMLRVLVPANKIVDLKSISNDRIGGLSVIRANAAVPVYRWFLAANILLEHEQQLGRVVPVPIDQPAVEGQPSMTTFQVLRTTREEHAEYRKLLDYSVLTLGIERGFETAARFSYEILRKRGVTQLTHEQVDQILTRVVLMNPSFVDCVLIANFDDAEAEATDLARRGIFRC